MKKMIEKRRVLKGKLIKVYVERQRLPNGYVAHLEVVEHPGAALIVPFLKKDEIILIRQYRPVIDSYIWELPAGTLHKDERPLRCVKREMAEEIGYEAKSIKKLGSIYTAPGYTTEEILIYEARGLKKVPYKSEEDEIITPKVLKIGRIKRLIRSGKITDAKTICALALARVI